MTYLGCPIYSGRQRIIYYSGLLAKVIARINGWQTKMLSYGGKAVLVKHYAPVSSYSSSIFYVPSSDHL